MAHRGGSWINAIRNGDANEITNSDVIGNKWPRTWNRVRPAMKLGPGLRRAEATSERNSNRKNCGYLPGYFPSSAKRWLHLECSVLIPGKLACFDSLFLIYWQKRQRSKPVTWRRTFKENQIRTWFMYWMSLAFDWDESIWPNSGTLWAKLRV